MERSAGREGRPVPLAHPVPRSRPRRGRQAGIEGLHPSPATSHLRPLLALPGRSGGRPDEARRMAVPADAGQVRDLRRQGQGGSPTPEPRRAALAGPPVAGGGHLDCPAGSISILSTAPTLLTWPRANAPGLVHRANQARRCDGSGVRLTPSILANREPVLCGFEPWTGSSFAARMGRGPDLAESDPLNTITIVPPARATPTKKDQP